MKIGVINHPLRDPLEEVEWIGKNGFDFVDFTFEPPYNTYIDLKRLKELLENYKLSAVGHTNPTLPAIYPIPIVREASISELKRSADFFALAGIKYMNIHPFYYTVNKSDEEIFDDNLHVLREMLDHCQQLGVQLMLENYFAPFNSPERFSKILKFVPGLKIHLDVGHLNVTESKVADTVREYFNRFRHEIIHIHIHDNHGITDEHLPLGVGNIDWPLILRIIKKAGYDGTMTLEVFSDDRDYLCMSRDKLRKYWQEASS